VPDLRPTPDRVRETVFNWLGPRIGGARCLDLFAGSGALGFEAASRGAVRVVLVDSDLRLVRNLRSQAAAFGAKNTEVIHSDALIWLHRQAQCPSSRPGDGKQAFDVVFLDPPFRAQLLPATCAALECSGCLLSGSLVYLETADEVRSGWLPEAWRVARYGKAGRVRYYLVERS
jgi:16S rRNA (guanine966-N2)-methyltransferase